MSDNRPQILIVEDEKSLLKAWAKKFERQGFRVLTAASGAAALMLALLYHPDMVVADIVMPSTDGLNLVKKLREDKWGRQVPIMFLSNWPQDRRAGEQKISGNAALLYHWDLEQVIRRVKNACAQKTMAVSRW